MNFAINPAPYIPVGMVEEDGGPGRRVRTTVCLGVPAVKRHEEYAIATTEDALTPAQRLALLHEISHYVTTVMRKEIATYSIHPHGVGIYKFRNSCERDILVHTSPHQVGPHTVTFVNHDAALCPTDLRQTRGTKALVYSREKLQNHSKKAYPHTVQISEGILEKEIYSEMDKVWG